MRVLFINTRDGIGGAAIAMRRLASGLHKNHDVEISFLVGEKNSNEENVISCRNKFELKVENYITRLTNKIGFQYTFLPFSSKNIIKYVKKIKPDIISIHNSHEGYFQTTLLEPLSKIAPIVWTLHDMWSFTGHCSYSYDCTNFKNSCGNCEDLNIYPAIGIDRTNILWKQKKEIYNQSNLTIVTPSDWLKNEALESRIFDKKKILCINNGIDLEIYKDKDSSSFKRKLKLDEDKKILLFSAASVNSKRKGGDKLVDSLKILNKTLNKKIYILTIGSGTLKGLEDCENFEIRSIGHISNDIDMSSYLNIADLFLFPTKADNLPNVLVESIACGLPCITFDIGGCGEIIINKKSGYLISPFDIQAFSQKIYECLHANDLNQLKISSRKLAEEKFDIKNMSLKYYKLFRELCDEI